tara:strand:+ start:352 stop:717 length:366 start_codon:yes stop_codon:yes gene_type:complete
MPDVPQEYMDDFDFGFSSVDIDELNNILGTTTIQENEEIKNLEEKLDLIIQMNSTCEGTNAVKSQYDELLAAKMNEIEKETIPLLVNLKKNKTKDYIHWPGPQREAQCDLQIQKILGMTRG